MLFRVVKVIFFMVAKSHIEFIRCQVFKFFYGQS